MKDILSTSKNVDIITVRKDNCIKILYLFNLSYQRSENNFQYIRLIYICVLA